MTTLKMLPITLGLVAAVIAAPVAKGALTVNQGVWGTAGDVGTMAWAIDQANTMPGLDTISIAPGLEINVDLGPPLAAPNTT